MGGQPVAGIGADGQHQAKGSGNGIGGDVVMGGTDTARGEQMVIGGAQVIDRRHDGVMPVADHPHFGQINAVARQFARQMVHVGIAGAARQDLIADHQHRSGWVGHQGTSGCRTS